MTMTREERDERLQEILGRLDEIARQDGAMIESISSRPVLISFEQLSSYRERFDERQQLRAELRNLISQLIED
jgi:hypothetical protein